MLRNLPNLHIDNSSIDKLKYVAWQYNEKQFIIEFSCWQLYITQQLPPTALLLMITKLYFLATLIYEIQIFGHCDSAF